MDKNDAKHIRPLSGMVLCQVDEKDDRRPGSRIIIPDSAKGRPDRCTVIAVSRGVHTAKGVLIEPPVRVGDECIFDAYRVNRVLAAGQLAQADGTPCATPGDYFLIAQNQLLAIIE